MCVILFLWQVKQPEAVGILVDIDDGSQNKTTDAKEKLFAVNYKAIDRLKVSCHSFPYNIIKIYIFFIFPWLSTKCNE